MDISAFSGGADATYYEKVVLAACAPNAICKWFISYFYSRQGIFFFIAAILFAMYSLLTFNINDLGLAFVSRWEEYEIWENIIKNIYTDPYTYINDSVYKNKIKHKVY